MLPRKQSDPSKPHNSYIGSGDDPIRLQTQTSHQIVGTPFDIAIGSHSAHDDIAELSSSSLSLSSSLSSSKILEPNPKRQRVQEYGQPVVIRDGPGNPEPMCDVDISLHHSMIRGEVTTTQSGVQPRVDNAMEEAMEAMMQNMDKTMQILHGNHTNTMCELIKAQHPAIATQNRQDIILNNTDADANADADATTIVTTTTTAIIPPSGTPATTSKCGDDGDDAQEEHQLSTDNSRDTAPIISHPVVFRHGIRQFTIQPLAIPSTIKPARESYQRYPKLDVKDEHLIVPCMILCGLAQDADILLPLASFQTLFFDRIHALNKENFRLICQPMYKLMNIAKVVLSVVYNRIRSALHTLFPKAGICGSKNEAEMEVVERELEKGPIEIAEFIVRDAMVVWNPIRLLITHLKEATIQYSKCITCDEQEALRKQIVWGYSWMRQMNDMAFVYGLFLWDSQWVSDDEWDTLVTHVSILTTEIFPQIHTLLKTPSDRRSTLGPEANAVIRYFKLLLGIVSCCFLHHYRPKKGKTYVPYRGIQDIETHRYTIPKSAYETALVSSTALFKQCVMEYMDHPATFPQFSSMENLLHSTTTTDDYASPYDYIMSEVNLACITSLAHVSSHDNRDDGIQRVCWKSRVPTYHESPILPTPYLIERIIQAPPRKNPVYQRIATIFPREVNRATLITSSAWDDPQFQRKPVNRSRNNHP